MKTEKASGAANDSKSVVVRETEQNQQMTGRKTVKLSRSTRVLYDNWNDGESVMVDP
jgi:hypothetical protein